MSDSIGIIFDMDGVIVHSNPAHKKAIQIFCDKYNLDVSDSLLENKVYGRTNKEWIPEVFGEVSEKKLKELADDKEQLFRDIFDPEENVVPGIGNFLTHLQKNSIPMAVATSAPRENAEYILSNLSIKNSFDVILDSSDVTIGKPNPEVYLKASKALGKRPESCMVFEDSIAGTEAARQAGAHVVGVMTTHTKEELAPCSLFIKDFSKLMLPKLLKHT